MRCVAPGCTREARHATPQRTCDKHYHHLVRFGRFLERTRFDRNEFEVDGDVARMYVYDRSGQRRGVVLLDAEDVPRVSALKWAISSTNGYVVCASRGLLLHRFIMNAPPGVQVDHINRDKLDNRKANLRLCTPSQNQFNRERYGRRRKGVGLPKGVYYYPSRSKPWVAHFTAYGKTRVKCFTSMEEAVAWRLEQERLHHGEFMVRP